MSDPRVSVITPWHGDTATALLPDYRQATTGAEVVTIDNATPYATRIQLQAWHQDRAGTYVRNDENRGFSLANNQGYLRATGDVIVFANSDIAGPEALAAIIASDVRDGALYGPSLQYQLVYGRAIPYLEGWCLAATRATWERLVLTTGQPWAGPWDAAAYPGPYWEDNDLCLRALRAGLSLIQTAWPIQHKGAVSAGPLARWGRSYERNRATFAERVRVCFGEEADHGA